MRDDAPPRAAASQLRGRYLVQNRALWTALAAADLGLSLGRRGRGSGEAAVVPPRRVLLANGGHLGDVVIASAVLPLVRAAWPDAEIGFLIGSWSRVVIQEHPLVARIHTVDHWKLNRSATSLRSRMRRYRETRSVALREIRAARYDLAIDLYAYFPNSIPLLWQAGIPRRVGYETGGFGPLLTESVAWQDSERHMAESHLDLLEAAGARWPARPRVRYAIPVRAGGAPRAHLGHEADYLVIHMGAGSPLKEWPTSRWREVVRRLAEDGHTIVFTGSGSQQVRHAEEAGEGIPGCRNLCDRLSWNEFVEVVQSARLVVGVDSVAGHIAAAVETPSVVIATGITNLHQWRPLHERGITVTHPTACAPCYRSAGCAGMACIREVAAEEVLRAIDEQLALVRRERATLVDASSQG